MESVKAARFERIQDNMITQVFNEEPERKRPGLEEGCGEGRLTTLNMNLSFKLATYDHYCCLSDLQHWRLASILID